MGKGGRQPQPDLKLLTKPTGNKAKDRSRAKRTAGGEVPDTKPLHGEVPDCPSFLKVGTEGRRLWRHYWQTAGEWLVKADVPIVGRLCRLQNIADELMAKIEDEGTNHPGEKQHNSRAHPLLRDYDQIAARIERLEDRLGLNPVERARIRIQPKEKESALDRWSSGRSKTGS